MTRKMGCNNLNDDSRILPRTTEILIRDKSPYWIRFLHPRYKLVLGDQIGKWVPHGTPKELESIAYSSLPLMFSCFVPVMKYSPSVTRKGEFHEGSLPSLCIYATKRTKDVLYKSLIKEIPDIYWQSNEDTERLSKERQLFYLAKMFKIS
jgi:hypothetical protein